MEILVALAILAIVLALVTPTIMPRLRGSQSAAISEQLDNLRVAIDAYRKDVRRYPHRLYELTHPLVFGDADACGATVSAANRGRWRGPYLTRTIDGDFPLADGSVRDILGRTPPNTAGGDFGQLQIAVAGVDSLVALDIEQQVDGNVDFSSGAILWSGAGGDTLKLQIPVSGC